MSHAVHYPCQVKVKIQQPTPSELGQALPSSDGDLKKKKNLSLILWVMNGERKREADLLSQFACSNLHNSTRVSYAKHQMTKPHSTCVSYISRDAKGKKIGVHRPKGLTVERRLGVAMSFGALCKRYVSSWGRG